MHYSQGPHNVWLETNLLLLPPIKLQCKLADVFLIKNNWGGATYCDYHIPSNAQEKPIKAKRFIGHHNTIEYNKY